MRSCVVCGTSMEDRAVHARSCSQSCRNKKKHLERMAEGRGTISRSHYYNLMARAARKGLDFTITLADVIVPAVCPITLKPFVLKGQHGGNEKPSVDRLDNSKGYVRGNIAVISNGANRAKSNLDLPAMRRLVRMMETAHA